MTRTFLVYDGVMIRRILLVPAFVLLGVPAALAQASALGPITGPDGSKLQAPSAARTRPAPAGVPGSRAEPELTAPADRPIGEMPPTDALFDAINRGDANAAREAIGRGADIYGHNVLGLTPLELSVDLGRNNISFLLLSLRGGAGYSTGGPQPGAASAPPSTAEQRRADRKAELEARRQQQAEARAAARVPTGPAPAPRAARLFAGDGGAAVPRAGFLGFDSAR